MSTHAITTASELDDERSYLVLWSYPSHDTVNVTLVVRVERAENVLGLGPVYRKIREYRHKADPGPIRFQQAIHHLEIHSSYRVRVAAYDSHHCEGQIAEVYLNSNYLLVIQHSNTVINAIGVSGDAKLDERSQNLHKVKSFMCVKCL